MQLRITPLLEGSPQANHDASFCIQRDALTPRTFVDWMDRFKALYIESTTNDDNTGSDNADKVLTVEDFGQFVVDLQLEPYPYIGGAAPRTIIPVPAGTDIVFTANESPPDQPIPFHHELAQTPTPPNYVFFYCDTPPVAQGETPIIDSTAVYRFCREQHAEFLHQLHQHGARYVRTLPPDDDPSSPIGRSYRNTWNVKSREELDQRLSTIPGCEWEWQPDGSVRITTEAVPALRLVTDHAQNYIYQHAFSNSIVAAYLGWQDSRNNRKEAVRLGNNDSIPDQVLDSIAAFMQANRVLPKWSKGGIMALNNQLVMHSRNPFTGPRRVLASIWGPPQTKVLQAPPANGIALGERPASFFEPLKPADPLVFGFWKVPQNVCAEVCYQAIAAGYRRLDCACDYGNEVQVGQGIARALQEGLCKREELFVTSKLWNTYHEPEHVPLALKRTLADLQLDYVDEYLIHFPISLEYVPFDKKYPAEWTNLEGKMVAVPNDIGQTWQAMEALVDQGLCQTIGVCNFSTQLLRHLLSVCRIRPTALQVELHPHNSQTKLVRFARDAGLRVTAFSVLGASSYLELDMATESQVLMNDPVVQQISQAKRKTPAQILIRWALQRNTLPLCKTRSLSRMQENRDVFDFFLSVSDMAALNQLNRNHRYNDPGCFCEGMGTFFPIYD